MTSPGPSTTLRTADDLVHALKCILESVAEETGGNYHDITDNQVYVMHNLYQLVASGGLKPEPSASETLSWCDGFISDWECTGVKSAAVQQLISLLNRPHIRGLLSTVEDVSSCRYSPRLPSVPFEVDEDEGLAIKIVQIMKKEEPLGATIKIDQGKVFIARVIAGGVADRSACIQEGDVVLEINSHPVSADMSIEEIVQFLSLSDNGCVTFKLIPAEIPHGKPDMSQLYIKALFDYDGSSDIRHPCQDAALSFSKGDILQLLVCNDQHWWQARCLGNGGLASDDHASHVSRVGLIPSESLQQKTKELEKDERRSLGSIRSKNSLEDDLIYESVCRITPSDDIVRPIVLIGPPGVGRNEVKRRLVMLYPEKFSTTVPTTSRLPRPGEIHGMDYNFVSREEMERMIHAGEMLEFGEYRGNLYGTCLSAVRTAREAAIPLLTPHPLALRQLRNKEFMPIVIFIAPPDSKTFKETRASHRSRTSRGISNTTSGGSWNVRGFTDAEIDQIIEGAAILDKQYGHLFDARIVNSSLEETMSQLVRLIKSFEKKPSWVPLSWASRSN